MEENSKEKRAAAVRKAVAKYDKSIDKITVRCPSGTLDRIKKLGYISGNAFAVQAIIERLEKEENRKNNACRISN